MPETPAAPLPVWIVEEKKFGRWVFEVHARTAAEALSAARVCGFTGPATVTLKPATATAA